LHGRAEASEIRSRSCTVHARFSSAQLPASVGWIWNSPREPMLVSPSLTLNTGMTRSSSLPDGDSAAPTSSRSEWALTLRSLPSSSHVIEGWIPGAPAHVSRSSKRRRSTPACTGRWRHASSRSDGHRCNGLRRVKWTRGSRRLPRALHEIVGGKCSNRRYFAECGGSRAQGRRYPGHSPSRETTSLSR